MTNFLTCFLTPLFEAVQNSSYWLQEFCFHRKREANISILLTMIIPIYVKLNFSNFCKHLLKFKRKLENFILSLDTQIREQMSGPDLYVFTLKFHSNFSPKKTFFSLFRVQKIKKKYIVDNVLCNFSVRTL